MIKSFSGQVAFCFAILEPYMLTLAKTDYPSIRLGSEIRKSILNYRLLIRGLIFKLQ